MVAATEAFGTNRITSCCTATATAAARAQHPPCENIERESVDLRLLLHHYHRGTSLAVRGARRRAAQSMPCTQQVLLRVCPFDGYHRITTVDGAACPLLSKSAQASLRPVMRVHTQYTEKWRHLHPMAMNIIPRQHVIWRLPWLPARTNQPTPSSTVRTALAPAKRARC